MTPASTRGAAVRPIARLSRRSPPIVDSEAAHRPGSHRSPHPSQSSPISLSPPAIASLTPTAATGGSPVCRLTGRSISTVDGLPPFSSRNLQAFQNSLEQNCVYLLPLSEAVFLTSGTKDCRFVSFSPLHLTAELPLQYIQ